MCKRCTDFFVHSASKTLLFHRAISELGENGGSLGEKKASRRGVERRRCAGNGAPLFFCVFFAGGISGKRMKMKRGVFSKTGFIAIQDPLFVIQ